MNKSGFVAPQVLIFALAFAAVAGSYLAFKPEIKNEEIVPESAVNSVVEELENSDWQTYRNEEYGFEFNYPKDWWSPTFKTWKDLNEFSSEGKSCPSKNDIYAILSCLSYKDIQTETIGENKFYFVESIWNENGLENKVLYAYFMREGRVYSVVFQNLNNVEDLDKITKEIFSTFKFIK